jgi:hypothetical protein
MDNEYDHEGDETKYVEFRAIVAFNSHFGAANLSFDFKDGKFFRIKATERRIQMES